jgi:nucleoid DNA-binding protein
MNKTDLVNAIAEVVATKKEAQAAVEQLFSSITGALRKGDSVTVAGFGTFKVVERKARQGRNPQTGAAIRIGARKAAKFVPGKALRDELN